MKYLISIIFALSFALSTLGQVVERSVEAIDYLKTNDEMNYRDTIIPMTDLTYNEFSSDSIDWHKEFVGGDIYIRFSNDVKENWITLYIEDKIGWDSITFNANTGYAAWYVDGLALDSSLWDDRYIKYEDTLVVVVTPTQLADSLTNYIEYADTITKVVTPTQLVDSIDALSPYDSIPFNENISVLPTNNYVLYADTANNTLSVGTGLGSTLQVGRESLIKVFNANGVMIPNGDIVSGSGIQPDGTIEVMRAIATDRYTALLWATTDIPVGEYGDAVVVYGSVRGVPTTGLSLGQVWLSDVDSGKTVSTPPLFDSYVYSLGAATIIGANGQYEARLDGIDFNNTIRNNHNGQFRETISATVSSTGSVITLSLEKAGGGDLTQMWSSGYKDLDCTDPLKTITLTAGTDTEPQKNFVYILESDPTNLVLSTVSFPKGVEHIKVYDGALFSATRTLNDDGLVNRNWNDHLQDTVGMGHILHITERMRQDHAQHHSGMNGVMTVAGAGTTLDISMTAGDAYQIHLQDADAMNTATGSFVYVSNDFTTKWNSITDIEDIVLDASGNSLTNTSYSLVFYSVVNKKGEADQYIINVSTNTYSKNFPDNAVDDALGYSVYDFPDFIKGKGVLVARFVVINNGGTLSLYSTIDLRGQIPNSAIGGVGGGAGGVTDFLSLSDTYNSYSGLGFTGIKVDQGEAGLEATQWTEDASGNFTSAGIVDATQLSINGTNINASGTLSNVAYRTIPNNFAVTQVMNQSLQVAVDILASDITTIDSLFVGTSAVVGGNIEVSGGNITTIIAGSASLFPANATAIAIGHSSTTITMDGKLVAGAIGINDPTPDFPLDIEDSSIESIVYERTGDSAKKWGFASDNTSTSWVNVTDAITGIKLENAGDVTITGDLAVSGGDLTTTQTTASLYDTNVTTLNIGGASTTTNIGSTSSGTTNVGFDLDVGNDLTINGTANIGNANSTFSDIPLTLHGMSVISGATPFGDYGGMLLSSSASFTGTARRYLITNALNGNEFAVIRSVDASTDPSLGEDGVVSSGTADLVIDNTGNTTLSGTITVSGTGSSSIAGDVRIGDNATPSERLEVAENNAESVISIHRDGSDIGTSTAIGKLSFKQDIGASIQEWGRISLGTNDVGVTRTSMGFWTKSTTGGLMEGLSLYGTNAGINVGIGTTSADTKLHIADGMIVNDQSNQFATTKFNSQGVAWSAALTRPSLIFNADAGDRPEIAWIRGGNTYPEFAIREATTANTGGTIYSGTGTIAPTATMAFNLGNVGINETAPTSTLDVNGSVSNEIRTTTTSTTLDATDYTLIITGGTPTITLPAASGASGRIYVVVNNTGGTRQISTYIAVGGSSDTDLSFTTPIKLQSNGTNWYEIGN